jgi:hypothetical protein
MLFGGGANQRSMGVNRLCHSLSLYRLWAVWCTFGVVLFPFLCVFLLGYAHQTIRRSMLVRNHYRLAWHPLLMKFRWGLFVPRWHFSEKEEDDNAYTQARIYIFFDFKISARNQIYRNYTPVSMWHDNRAQTSYHRASSLAKHCATWRLGVAPVVGEHDCTTSGSGNLAPCGTVFGN